MCPEVEVTFKVSDTYYFMQVFGLCTQNSPQQITQYLKAKLLVGKLAYVLVQSMALNDLSLAR